MPPGGLLLLLCFTPLMAMCPFSAMPVPDLTRNHHGDRSPSSARDQFDYGAALENVNFTALQLDLETLMVTSQEFWPADYGHYGPFFIRLAWHCAGSYRVSDGRGGCDGGRQRFDPERSWMDNTNLDKARALLWPIKAKYGLGLSWGDLIILAGTTAIRVMGGPVLGFCGGRVDDPDGMDSLELGPTPEQEALAPCPVDGQCPAPLGATTLGLIYVNPEGPMGHPDPAGAAHDIRDTFGRMHMNDSETVALIGGGHTFGKTHGACPLGPGPSPQEDPSNPWPGKCGTGKGADTFTSGLEGPWTSTPTNWSMSYFENLMEKNHELTRGPGGKWQWRYKGTPPQAPGAHGGPSQPLMMLTTDIALRHDPAGQYPAIARHFLRHPEAFRHAFAHAWYKLTSRDMGPATRCRGPQVPPPQPWQYPLPAGPAPHERPDFAAVRKHIAALLHKPQPSVLAPDEYDGKPYYGALFVRLAFQCASSFRHTDYLGGCNGARLRFPPQSRWPTNVALDSALELLAPVKKEFGPGLSWADLIVLAGNTALEAAGAPPLPFCPGRSDAAEGSGAELLSPGLTGDHSETPAKFREWYRLLGLTPRQAVALMGGHSMGQMHANRSGFAGPWTATPTRLSNAYFRAAVGERWDAFRGPAGKLQFKARGKDLYALRTDRLLAEDPELLAVVQEFAVEEGRFLAEFAAAWTKVMNADRFDGPTGSVCPNPLESGGSRG